MCAVDGSQSWQEMKRYVDLNQADGRRLRALLPFVRPRIEWMTDNFYAAVLRSEGARNVLQSEEQIARLKRTMGEWVIDLLSGPYDEAYFRRRRRIGDVHVRVGLPDHYMFTAMNLMRQNLCEIAQGSLAAEEAWPTCRALLKVTDLDLAAMTSAYMVAREQIQLRSLQDLIVQNMPVTVLCLDRAGLVTSATRPSARLFGAQAELGRHYERFLPRELVEVADLPTCVGRALATGREITVPRVVLGEGTTARHFRLTLVPLDHDLARILLHIEELTDVVEAEARVQQAESLARIGSLSAHLAHEIRNPLAAISATLQVIVGSLPADDRRKRILGKVQEQVHRLDRLVSDLLGYARPAEARLEQIRLSVLGREALAQAGVNARVEGEGDLSVLVDCQYAHQILVNLLQNARDASGPLGQIRVRLGPGARVDVFDDGPGVSDEVGARLFEPFVTTKTRGTGLGLAISRKLAEAMGGGLSLHPHPDPASLPTGRGPGACFRLSLSPAGRPGHVSPAGTAARIG